MMRYLASLQDFCALGPLDALAGAAGATGLIMCRRARRRGLTPVIKSAFAKTPWTCETTKPFSYDERLKRTSRASSEGALTRGNAAQTQCYGHLRHCLATPTQLPCLFSTPFSPTPESGHYGSPVESPVRSLRHVDRASGRQTGGATAGGSDPPRTPSPGAPSSFTPEERPTSPSSAWCSAPAPAAPPCPHRAAVGVAVAGAQRRRRAASAAPARPRATPRCGRRLRVRPSGAPASSAGRAAAACPLPLPGGAGGFRRCGGGGRRGGRHRPCPRAHTRSVDGAHPPAGATTTSGEGKGRENTNPGRRHAVGRGRRSPRRRRRGRRDGSPPRAAVAPPAGRPVLWQSRATAEAAAAGRRRNRGFGHRPHGRASGRRGDGGGGSCGGARRLERHQPVGWARRPRRPTAPAPNRPGAQPPQRPPRNGR